MWMRVFDLGKGDENIPKSSRYGNYYFFSKRPYWFLVKANNSIYQQMHTANSNRPLGNYRINRYYPLYLNDLS